MPIPKPRKGETHQDFVSRCAGDTTMNHDYPDGKQRVAVCFSAWRDAHGNAGVGAAPKAATPACMPNEGENQSDYLDRCTATGAAEDACREMWDMHQGGGMEMSHQDMETKWHCTLLEVKGLNDGERSIRGIATTPSTDMVGDIVESMGAKYKEPISIPLLWQHKHDRPIGEVTHVVKSKDGITFQAKIAKVDEPGQLKDRVDEAWQSVRAGLVKGVSIGFTPIRGQSEYIKDSGGIRFKEWNWHELSLVTVPANSDATISLIRSLDSAALQAAKGHQPKQNVRNPAGVTARSNARTPEGKMARTIAEDISAYANTLNAHQTKMNEMMDKASEDGVTFDDDQERDYDELKEKCAQITKHLDRLREREKQNVNALVPVVDGHAIGSNAGASLANRMPAQIKAKAVEPGTAFVRYVAALAMAKGNIQQAAHLATRDAWKDTPEVAAVLEYAAMEGTTQLKAPVAAATTYDATWAGPLVYLQNMTSEFISFLRPATILDRITGMRRVPFNIRIPTQTAGTSANWVGEGSMKPLTSAAFSTVTMAFSKVAAVVAFTQESLRFSNPSLEAIIRQDLIDAIAFKLDTDFLDPAKAADTGAGGPSPASVLNGVTPVLATGTDYIAAQRDIKAVLSSIAALNIPMTNGVWVMHPTQAIALSMMLNPLGQVQFPAITPDGGTLAGFRVITSTNVKSSGNSPTDGYMIAFLCPGEILLADDGNVTVDASDQASLQFESSPDSPVSASTTLISLWQSNMVALRAEREINWLKRRAGATAYIDYAKYSP